MTKQRQLSTSSSWVGVTCWWPANQVLHNTTQYQRLSSYAFEFSHCPFFVCQLQLLLFLYTSSQINTTYTLLCVQVNQYLFPGGSLTVSVKCACTYSTSYKKVTVDGHTTSKGTDNVQAYRRSRCYVRV